MTPRSAGSHPKSQPFDPSKPLPEPSVKVHHILFILWFIVFIFWMAKQFKAHNKRKGR